MWHICKIIFIQIFLFIILKRSSSVKYYEGDYNPYKKNKRIIDGRLADIGKYPFVAGIIKIPIPDAYFCGSCIISDYWLLTAEHCYTAVSTISSDSIVAISNNNTWKYGIIHKIDKWVRRDPPDQANFDLALVRVVTPFTAENEKAIKIAADGYVLRKKTSVKVLGWGTKYAGVSYVPSTLLQGANLKMYSDYECRNIFTALHQQYSGRIPLITPRTFCAGPGKMEHTRDPCYMDSGGPIIDNDILIGIVSWGPMLDNETLKCGMGYPTVYVRLWMFEYWIHEIEQQENETIANFKVDPGWLTPNPFGKEK